MRFGTDHLRAKALLALEEATQECRYGPVPRTFAIRFALAYLWSLAPASRRPHDEFWRALGGCDMWRFSSADRALAEIYRQLGVARADEVSMVMWRRSAKARRSDRNPE